MAAHATSGRPVQSDLTARPSAPLRRETIDSLFTQALVARRQQAFCYTAETVLDFEPAHYQQMAGLVCYYSGAKYHYLYVSHTTTPSAGTSA